MTSSTPLRRVSPAAVKAILGDSGELALIDLREELIFSRSHLLWARSVPLSRLELRFARLVPRRSTRIVLIDDNDGLSDRAAEVLTRAGYSDLSSLEGGVAGWDKAGFVLFSGVHVPSKAFGEFIEHERGTPSIGATELDALMRSGADMVVLDSRPFDEYARASIPTSTNVPGAELVLRVRDIAPSPGTTVVVNCAGRTRSIIGAQSLINAGVPNKVMALRNGTMGWHLAGLACDSGKDRRAPNVSSTALAWAKAQAEMVARKFAIERIDHATLERWRDDPARTTYIFDVRDPVEYQAGHLPGALSAPGGQLVQATDTYAGTLGARIVLSDDQDVRAVMTASWLKQMGWREVYVLPQAGEETGIPPDIIIGKTPPEAAITVTKLKEMKDATIIDLSTSPNYRRGHIPGAWFAIRARLSQALEKIAPRGPLVLTSEDGVLAGLAVAEARALVTGAVHWLQGGNAAWAPFALARDLRMADEPLDVWLKPYEQAGDTEAAMNAYLSWEVDLLERVERDDTCNFSTASQP